MGVHSSVFWRRRSNVYCRKSCMTCTSPEWAHSRRLHTTNLCHGWLKVSMLRGDYRVAQQPYSSTRGGVTAGKCQDCRAECYTGQRMARMEAQIAALIQATGNIHAHKLTPVPVPAS